MAPALRPGDWLLVDPLAYRDVPPAVGDIVVAPDPREPGRLLVKRVGGVPRTAPSSCVVMRPTHPPTHARSGPLPASVVTGRVWARYWPLRRVGLLR